MEGVRERPKAKESSGGSERVEGMRERPKAKESSGGSEREKEGGRHWQRKGK